MSRFEIRPNTTAGSPHCIYDGGKLVAAGHTRETAELIVRALEAVSHPGPNDDVKAAAERLLALDPLAIRVPEDRGGDGIEYEIRTDIEDVARFALEVVSQQAATAGEIRQMRQALVKKYTNKRGVAYQECRVCSSTTIQGAVLGHWPGCLLATAPAGAGEAGTEVEHIDGDPTNNRPDNLRLTPPSPSAGR